MRAHYDYFYEDKPNDSLTVDDIGNVCIVANNDTNCRWILYIKTEFGITRLFEYGPHSDGVCTYLMSKFEQIDYNERKIDKIIYSFLNTRSKGITQAQIVDFEDVRQIIQNPLERMQ